jgi:hypothetical protein
MRYFITTNASRRYKAGGVFFNFELTSNVGSTWRGVLAVDDSAASALLAARIPQITEATLEEYEAEKKTVYPISSSKSNESRGPQLPTLPPLGAVAVVEGSTTVLHKAVAPVAPVVTSVEIQTQKIAIVDELALAPSEKKPRAA